MTGTDTGNGPRDIPRSALVLTALGVLPFVFGAAFALDPVRFGATVGLSPFVAAGFGPVIVAAYGRVILAFMSGVLWGFATRAAGRTAALAYAASVLPALYVFFATSFTTAPLVPLAAGFAALLVFDYGFWRAGLAPAWWLWLRLPVTALVLACLAVALSAQ